MDVVISGARGTGKTTELVALAAAEGLTVVSAHAELARYAAAIARAMGLRIPPPVTWDELGRGWARGRSIPGLAVDDLDLLAEQWLMAPVRAATLNVTPPR